MSDVELGGGTAFINVGALVVPRKVTHSIQKMKTFQHDFQSIVLKY